LTQIQSAFGEALKCFADTIHHLAFNTEEGDNDLQKITNVRSPCTFILFPPSLPLLLPSSPPSPLLHYSAPSLHHLAFNAEEEENVASSFSLLCLLFLSLSLLSLTSLSMRRR
jgi:hypothetical protein